MSHRYHRLPWPCTRAPCMAAELEPNAREKPPRAAVWPRVDVDVIDPVSSVRRTGPGPRALRGAGAVRRPVGSRVSRESALRLLDG